MYPLQTKSILWARHCPLKLPHLRGSVTVTKLYYQGSLLTQLASSSLLSPAPIPGLGRGCPAGWPCCWGTDCHPLLQGCLPAQGMQTPPALAPAGLAAMVLPALL